MWFVLGFTYDAVVGAWQDSRLAAECARVLCDPSSLLQTPGEGEHLVYWFVEGSAARLLDEGEVLWRQFVVGLTAAPPAAAHAVLNGQG
jgi:hypothetical protein